MHSNRSAMHIDLGKLPITPLTRLAGLLAAAAIIASSGALAASARGAMAWSTPQSVDPGGSLTSISCPSTALCAAVDRTGHVVATATPAVGGAPWSSPAAIDEPPAAIAAISCPSAGLCVAVDAAGHALTSANPTGGAAAWSRRTIDESPSHEPVALTGVSCPTTALCVAVDAAGNVLVSTSPTTGSWKAFDVAGSNALQAVSCVGPSLCVAVDRAGDAIASSEPAGGVVAWRSHPIDPALAFEAVSCAASGVCVAVDADGQAFASLDPTGATPTWAGTPIDSPSSLTGVACVSRGACLAVDGAGQSFFSEAPAAVPPAWSGAVADAEALTGVACTTEGFCAAVDASGRVLTTTLPAPPAPPPPPVALVHPHPTISGVPAVGSRLLCNAGVPDEAAATLTYAWWRDGSPIAGATAPNHLVGKADAKHHLQCLVTATNAAGSVTAHSAFVTVPAQGVLAAAGETTVGRLRVRGRRLEVPLRCSPRAVRVCVVTVHVSTLEALRGNHIRGFFAHRPRSSPRFRWRTVTLAAARARLAPDQRGTVVAPLNGAGRRLLARYRQIPAQVIVAGTVIGIIDATLARRTVIFKR